MKHRNILLAALSAFSAFALGCGGSDASGSGGSSGTSGSSSGSGTSGPGGGSTTSSGSSSSSGGGDGCERGLVRCDGACVDIQANDAHCGACGAACAEGELCIDRQCVPSGPYCSEGGVGMLCGDQCVLLGNVDHCGGCGMPCDAKSYCDGGASCRAWQGDGTSCASPIVISEPSNLDVAFWFVDGGAQKTLTCGALEPRPTVSFRWAADKTSSGFKFSVRGAKTDDLVLELFSAATCDAVAAVGCNDDEAATQLTPELEADIESGKTYFIVVGSKSPTPPAGRFTLHLDD